MADTIFGNPEGEKPAASKQETPAAETSTQQDGDKSAESSQTSDPYANLLTEIRTDDGRQKYATVSDAINSIPHAQDHIKSLTDKVKEMERQLEEAKRVDDIMKRVESEQAAKEQPSSKQGLDETKIAELLETQLTEREKRMRMQQNVSSVTSTLKEVYGDKAEAQYIAKAEELGLDVDVLNSLSARSPKAVLEYFGLTKKSDTSGSGFNKSSVNTSAMDTRPKQEEDPMARFRASDSELLQKWRKSASKFEG